MLISVSYLVEIDNEEQKEKIINNFSNDQYLEFDNKNINLKWNETSSKLLNPN